MKEESDGEGEGEREWGCRVDNTFAGVSAPSVPEALWSVIVSEGIRSRVVCLDFCQSLWSGGGTYSRRNTRLILKSRRFFFSDRSNSQSQIEDNFKSRGRGRSDWLNLPKRKISLMTTGLPARNSNTSSAAALDSTIDFPSGRPKRITLDAPTSSRESCFHL